VKTTTAFEPKLSNFATATLLAANSSSISSELEGFQDHHVVAHHRHILKTDQREMMQARLPIPLHQ
jgi:hypothetical protein